MRTVLLLMTALISAPFKLPAQATPAQSAQRDSTFHITPLRPIEDLRREALRQSPPHEDDSLLGPDLVELVSLDSSIRLDIRYATSNNFMGAPMYSSARAFMQRPAALAVARASRRLHELGYGLLIHDAYRPWYVTWMFWEATEPRYHSFVANPARGSKHNRGCAVDLTLYRLDTGLPAEMPSTYDEFTERAHPDYAGGTAAQRERRELLRRTMEAEGFTVDPGEWWHYDYRDWARYPVLNATFEQLRR
jgi:D-alanyl-D-alanine dipeptidase